MRTITLNKEHVFSLGYATSNGKTATLPQKKRLIFGSAPPVPPSPMLRSGRGDHSGGRSQINLFFRGKGKGMSRKLLTIAVQLNIGPGGPGGAFSNQSLFSLEGVRYVSKVMRHLMARPPSRSVGDMLPAFILAPIRRIPQDAPLTLVGASGETLAATAICLSGKRRYIKQQAASTVRSFPRKKKYSASGARPRNCGSRPKNRWKLE